MHAFPRYCHPKKSRGFTLLELMVVVGIIAVLFSILLPSIQRSRDQAMRTECASNMHQWGAAARAYAADFENSFPYNLDGQDVSWIGPTAMKGFSVRYLMPLTGFKQVTVNDYNAHVMFCPTQQWHVWYRANGGAIGNQELVGYFWLPYRSLTYNSGDNYQPASNPNGNGWVTKQRFGGQYKNAPILTDMIQSAGGIWGGPVPYSSHCSSSNIPPGGNFMFEDGSVQWYDINQVGVGCTCSWQFHYAITVTN
jgi:prepilin-type N-terminal cleavage/methylation domain-containing protein